MKTRKLFAVVIAIMLFVTVLCSCTTKLSGTYKSTGLLGEEITFTDEIATLNAFGVDISGKYKIEDGKIIITYSLLGLSYEWEKPFEKQGNSIFIDGTEFVKQ